MTGIFGGRNLESKGQANLTKGSVTPEKTAEM
jgi:hypothetical protein